MRTEVRVTEMSLAEGYGGEGEVPKIVLGLKGDGPFRSFNAYATLKPGEVNPFRLGQRLTIDIATIAEESGDASVLAEAPPPPPASEDLSRAPIGAPSCGAHSDGWYCMRAAGHTGRHAVQLTPNGPIERSWDDSVCTPAPSYVEEF